MQVNDYPHLRDILAQVDAHVSEALVVIQALTILMKEDESLRGFQGASGFVGVVSALERFAECALQDENCPQELLKLAKEATTSNVGLCAFLRRLDEAVQTATVLGIEDVNSAPVKDTLQFSDIISARALLDGLRLSFRVAGVLVRLTTIADDRDGVERATGSRRVPYIDCASGGVSDAHSR